MARQRHHNPDTAVIEDEVARQVVTDLLSMGLLSRESAPQQQEGKREKRK
jgi:hypothetical protein